MKLNELKLSICHLYPDLLNLYGDRGNLIALKKRCEWRGIEAVVHSVGIGQPLRPKEYDLIFLGGGQDFEQTLILRDLVDHKGDAIRAAVESDTTFLCICGGYQMMGNYYVDQQGNKMDCLHAIPVWTESGEKRLIGNVICRNNELAEHGADPILVGFENHSGRTILGEGVRPLATIQKGFGNNGTDGTEGARYRNVFGTYLHGSFLPKNPDMTDFLIQKALFKKAGQMIPLAKLENEFENNARAYVQTCKN